MSSPSSTSAPPVRPKGKMMLALVVALVLIIAALAGAWAAGLFGGKEKKEKVLVVGMAEDITIMDPSKANWMFGPADVIYDTLFTRDLEGGYADGLVDTWVMDRDNLTLLMNLKPNMKFHDGTPCDAEAIKWNVEYQGGPDAYSAYMFASIAEVWVIDAVTVQFNLSYADSSLMFNLSNIYSAIMSPAAVQAAGDSYGTGTNVTGSGPFMIQKWIPGESVTVVKNPNYSWAPRWMENRGAAKIDKIIYKIVPDDASRTLAYESGDIDVLMSVPPYKIGQYQARSDTEILSGPGQGVYFLEFNCGMAPWDNVSLRKAFGFMINRTEIVQTVWYGYGEPAPNYLPPILPETNTNPALNFTYDPVRAAELLSIAGYVDSDQNGWVEKHHQELTLRIWTTTRGEDSSMSALLKEQIEECGVHVALSQYDMNTLEDLCSQGDFDSDMGKDSWPRADIMDWLLGSDYIPYPNTAHFSDPVFDDLILQGYAATSDAEYTAAMTAAHERLLELSPWAPIFYWEQIHAVHTWVSGWTVHPLGQETVQDIVDVDINK